MLSRVELFDERQEAIVISNRLLQNSYFDLNLIPLKTLLYTISKIQPGDTGDKRYCISVRALCEVCNMPVYGTNTYKGRTGIIYRTMRELRGQHLDLFDEKGRAFNTGWFSSVKMENDNDTIYYRFDDNLMPYLFNLQKELGYTITIMDIVAALELPASIRLYLYLRSILYKGKRQRIELEEIRQRTGYAGKYSAYKDLRVRVLSPAIEDINQYTDIQISYNEVKQGRKVVALDFTIERINGGAEDDMRYLNRRKALRGNPNTP